MDGPGAMPHHSIMAHPLVDTSRHPRAGGRATSRGTAVPSGAWTVDPERSTVGFSVRHLMITTVRGRFTDFEGALHAVDGRRTRATGAVRVTSIDTGDAVRDERLLGPEFFNAATSPEIRFVSTSVAPIGDGTLRIAGDLTIKDVTREIELRARPVAMAEGEFELHVEGTLGRSDFGIESAQLLEAGISNKVELVLHLALARHHQ